MNAEYKDRILGIVRGQKLAVVATVNPERPTPESALIGFAEDGELSLYFQTGRHTRKAANLAVNPAVSLVIGLGQEDRVTVQYEGRAVQLTDEAEIEACKQRFIDKNSPASAKFLNHPTAIFFKVMPTWIGCSDYTKKPPEVIEWKPE